MGGWSFKVAGFSTAACGAMDVRGGSSDIGRGSLLEFDLVLDDDFRGLLNQQAIATFVMRTPTNCPRSHVRVIMIQHSRDVHVGAGLVLSVVIAIILVVVARF